MLCHVDGLRVWADALPPRVSSGCFATIIIYDFTSLLVSKALSSFIFGSVSWGLSGGGPPPSWFLIFVYVGDVIGNPWITCESFISVTLSFLQLFFLMKNA